MPTHTTTTRLRRGLPLAAAALLLTACATTGGAAPSPAGTSDTGAATASATVGGNMREATSATTRVLLSHAEGLTLLDADTGEVVQETAHPGFLRLNDAGDGRHVLVTDGDRFLVYDAGVRSVAHGDHSHHYTYDPGLTDVTYEAAGAGHVVAHDGVTTLFSDGSGEALSIDSAFIADPTASVRRFSTGAAHHGVALVLSDDSLLTTQGTEESRSTVQVIRDDQVVASTDNCPGVHGEATAAANANGDVVLLGCTNGPVVWRDGSFHKVNAPDTYARTGNSSGSPASPIVLTDYKTDPDAEQEHPTAVALVDTRDDSLRLVELGSSYWFRSLARGPEGEALVLTYDGAVQVIDPDSGTVTASIPAIGAWTEKADWQEPGPAIKVAGDRAYVTDAEAATLVVIDLSDRAVVNTFALDHTPVEIAVVDGSSGEDAHDHE